MNRLDPNLLVASVIWSSIGIGYAVYGKRQQSFPPLAGGILMIVASYFAPSALIMSLICLVLITAIHVLLKQGY